MNYLQIELNKLMDERSSSHYSPNFDHYFSFDGPKITIESTLIEDLNKKISERQNINFVKTNDHAEIKGYFPNELFPSAFNNRQLNVDPEPKPPDPYIKGFHLESDYTKY
jgi:hypothetical protein